MTRTCNEWPLASKPEHKTFKKMKNQPLALTQGENYQAIDELINQTNIERASAKRIKELRERAKEEAIRLYRERGWEIGSDLPYNNVTLRLYEETVMTWELNHQIDDPLLDLYRAQFNQVAWLEGQLKYQRAKLKQTGLDLAKAHPNSESV